MRPPIFDAATLARLFHDKTVATMEEMKAALGTGVDMTVFRKLRQLGYHSSYSDGGRFYTLAQIAQFDALGLWSHCNVHFSRFGSLLNTVEHFVERSPMGYRAAELRAELHVDVKQPLRQLVQRGKLVREALDAAGYLYCTRDVRRCHEQLERRQHQTPSLAARRTVVAMDDEAKAALLLFLSVLDERQRRLYAGLEALRLGYGGDQQIAALTGLDVHTVARGRRELCAHGLEPPDAIRHRGAGRPMVEKKRPRSSLD